MAGSRSNRSNRPVRSGSENIAMYKFTKSLDLGNFWARTWIDALIGNQTILDPFFVYSNLAVVSLKGFLPWPDTVSGVLEEYAQVE